MTEKKPSERLVSPEHYPSARRGDQVDDYHGTKIADPYRWLEDPDSPETRAWIDAENALTRKYFAGVPEREAIHARLTKLWNYERYGVPSQRAGRYFYTRNGGLQEQSVLYVADSLNADPRVLLDPNALSKDGPVALTGTDLSEDGKLLAYGIARAGSDWQEWRVRDVDTSRDRDDVLHWVKFSSASWTHDGEGFFYSRYDEPAAGAKLTGVNYFQKLYYHRLGTPQAEDRLVYERPDQKEWGFGGEVTDDGRYLIISVWRGSDPHSQIFYVDLADEHWQVRELVTGFDADHQFIDNDGPMFWVRSDLDAPNYRLLAIDVGHPDREHWRELIPAGPDVLNHVAVVGHRFIASYLASAHARVLFYQLDGAGDGELDLPGLGTVGGFTGRRKDTETFYAFTGFTAPATIYRYDFATRAAEVFRRPKLDFASKHYEAKQVFFESTDGARVPMFIVHRQGLALEGNNPTLLYGYGGFRVSLTPSFSPAIATWLERGGVYAMPNLRGGGEFGAPWHEAGRGHHKQQVFDDFLAAAQWLIDHRYTSPQRLAISGRSNGGLLVGACITQRPDLFGAAVAGVGVMDMLRFHKFTIGWAWTSEYGSSDNADDFKTLYAYSPLHRIKEGEKYPATLIITADHDDRVVPAHSFKFAAALQHAQAADRPVLARIETSAGHGAGTPTSKLIDELADEYSFLAHELGGRNETPAAKRSW